MKSDHPVGSYGYEVDRLHEDWLVAVKPLKDAVSELPWYIRWLLYLVYPFLRYKDDK